MEGLLKCKLCQQDYNLAERLPKIIIPCGHTVCQQCLDSMKDPQDMGQIVCKVNHDTPLLMDSSISNNSIIEELKSNFGMLAYCGSHKGKPADFFDQKKDALVCVNCAFFNQQNIVQIQDTQRELKKLAVMVLKAADAQEEKLKLLKQQLDDHRTLAQSITDKSASFDGSVVLKQLKEGVEYFIRNNVECNFRENAFYQLGLKTALSESKVLNNNGQYLSLLEQWVDKKFNSRQLLYRGTEDGFSWESFHSKCTDKGATLTLVLTQENIILGGFTSLSWKRAEEVQLSSDKSAFLFNLTREAKYPVNAYFDQAISSGPQNLVAFGSDDLIVVSDCDKNRFSSCYIGASYDPLQMNRLAFTEDKKFLVKELELYQLKEI